MKASSPAPSEPTLPAPVAPPSETPVPVPPPVVPVGLAAWPGWYSVADLVMVVLVLVAAGLAASFAARNSDVWRHLAGGRLVATGQYPWGGDPFSFTADGRPWVNTSWLYDVGLYAAYQIAPDPGGIPVKLKAFAFAAAFGLMFLLRRSGHALWPWAVTAALGILASAPYATLRPSVASMLFLAVTLLVLYRGRWAVRSWRQPGILAGLFAVWANVDQWFVLGPIAVLLVLVGELLHGKLFPGQEEAGSETFPPAPPVPALIRTLLVGTAACLLNPTLLAGLANDPGEAVAQLVPADLGWGLPPEAAEDPEFALLAMSPLSTGFMERPQFGYNLNGLAAAVLLVGGGFVLLADFSRARATHIVLWVGFAAIALQQYRLIPFFAVVAAPLIAAHLNRLSTRVRLGSAADQSTRVWLALSGVGRILTVTATVVMAAAGWPGWLHPQSADPAFTRRAEGAVEADPGPTRVAQVLNRWRTDGHLPEATRGIATSPEYGDYCAWFAPTEKVFMNSRFGFHRSELADLIRLRKAVAGVREPGDAKPDPNETKELLQKYEAGYVVLPGAGRAADTAREEQREKFLRGVFGLLLSDRNEWKLWHLDGRAAVVGKATAAGADAVRFDPVQLAFGPDVQPLPKGTVPTAPTAKPDLEWYEGAFALWVQFTARPRPLPAEADDAAIFDRYSKVRSDVMVQRWQMEMSRRSQARAAAAGIAVVAISGSEPPPTDDVQHAYPLLALRAARRAVAAAPDRTETYRALAGAYEANGMILFQPSAIPVGGPRYNGPDQPPVFVPYQVPGDRPEQVITAVARALARLPRPSDASPELALEGLAWSQQLASLYLQPPGRQLSQEEFDRYLNSQQLDLSREALLSAKRYAEVVKGSPELIARMIPPGAKVDDPLAAILKELDTREKMITELIVPRNDALERQAGTGKPVERFFTAIRYGLPGKAMETFKEVKDPKEFGSGEQHLAAAIQLIELELRAGRLEEAVIDLEALIEGVGENSQKAGGDNPVAKNAVRYLRFRVARLVGNYEQAGEGWVDLFRDQLPTLPAELKHMAEMFVPGLEAGHAALGGGTGQIVHGSVTGTVFQANQLLAREAIFYFNRAVMALQEGNIKEAAARFEQALKPQGVALIAIGVSDLAREIEVYQRLIRQAEGKK